MLSTCLAVWPGVRGHRVRCTPWLPLAVRVHRQANGGRPWPGTAWPWLGHLWLRCLLLANGLGSRPSATAAALLHGYPTCCRPCLEPRCCSWRCPTPSDSPGRCSISSHLHNPTTKPELDVVVVYCIVMPCYCMSVATRGHTFNGSVQALTDPPLAPRSCCHIPTLPCLVWLWPGHLCQGRFPRCGGGSAPLCNTLVLRVCLAPRFRPKRIYRNDFLGFFI